MLRSPSKARRREVPLVRRIIRSRDFADLHRPRTGDRHSNFLGKLATLPTWPFPGSPIRVMSKCSRAALAVRSGRAGSLHQPGPRTNPLWSEPLLTSSTAPSPAHKSPAPGSISLTSQLLLLPSSSVRNLFAPRSRQAPTFVCVKTFAPRSCSCGRGVARGARAGSAPPAAQSDGHCTFWIRCPATPTRAAASRTAAG